jgi:hypothetical protein
MTIQSQPPPATKPDRETVTADLHSLTSAQIQHLQAVYAMLEAMALDRTLRTGLKAN